MTSHMALSLPQTWQVPAFEWTEFSPRARDYCIIIPVLNEGERFKRQISGMAAMNLDADIIVADGGSNDGATDPAFLKNFGDVHALLIKTGPGKLSAQLRMGFAYALSRGYQGAVIIDGNGKDGYDAIPSFVTALRSGYDFVQGSRYLPGGEAVNTPHDRELAVKIIHAPLISLAAGFRYTDTTNGFRAFSARLLTDDKVQVFRDIFDTYNLHYYLSVRAPRLGYRVCELPVRRAYPEKGPTPTKISGWRGRLLILRQLFLAITGAYNPQP